jgi:hypothetical protein
VRGVTALPRGTCQECGQSVPVRRNGVAREHLTRTKLGECRGSGRPTDEAIAALDANVERPTRAARKART